MLAYVALGSNLGNRREHMVRATRDLAAAAGITVEAGSGLYETSPVGGPPDQPLFLNAVLGVRTELRPSALLKVCLAIESELGRRRDLPNGPRTVDLDVLLCEDQIIDSKELTVPHPRLHLRRFVLEPLSEVAPNVTHPVLRRTATELLALIDSAGNAAESCRRIEGPGWLENA